MKIAFESFTAALVSYWKSDVIQKAPQDERFALGVAAVAAPSLLSGYVNRHSDMVLSMGLMDESNMVDVDVVEELGAKLLDEYGPLKFPFKNPLAIFKNKEPLVLSFTSEDVRKVCQMCRNMGG